MKIKQKKILIFTDYFLPDNNGIIQYVTNLYKELIYKKKVEISIFTFKTNKNLKTYEKMEEFEIYRIKAKSILGGTYNLPNFFDWIKISKELKNKKFDVVNTHTRFFISSVFGTRFASKNKIKHIHTEHGAMFVPHPNLIVKSCARIFDETFGRFVMKKSSLVSPVSKKGISFCKKLGAKNIQVVENGISKNFKKEKIILDKKISLNKKLNICFVGRLVEAKGVSDLIKVCSKLKFDYNLFIIGDGNYKNKLEKLSDSLKVNSYFLGWKTRDYIMSFLLKMDVFVNPSYAEGFPTSVLEAGISNIKVIATNTGGTSEIISNTKDGFLFEPKDIKTLEKKICFVNKNKKIIGDLKKHILENFEWKKLSNKVYKIL
jgi:glycosyltransferase involved in cell wall biosynthesis